MCGVYFRTARFALLDSGHFWLSRTPEKPGSRGWGAILPRMVTWVKLRPSDGGSAFCWFNTHFDAWNGHARARSAELLRDRVHDIAGGMPCVVTGDFNSAADSAPYRALLATPLRDVFRSAHPVLTRKEGTVHFFTGWSGGRRMDWILASSHFQTITSEIDRTRGPGGYPSDHFPVTATLRVPAASQLPLARRE
jgi:endonuclease/exonuclease/phosphatase family metal-dependent hydrolase